MADHYITFGTSIELDAPLERLWPLLSDTDRINRLLGLPASEQIQANEDLSRSISGHFLGVPVHWREYPFEWIFEQWFEITRVFFAPFPVEFLITRTVFTPLNSRSTRVDVQVRMTARNLIGSGPARWFVEYKFLRSMRRVYEQLGQLAHEASTYVPPPPLRKPVVNLARLNAGAERLYQVGVRPALITRLTEHLSSADDPDVVKIRPFALADRWEEPRLDVLRMFLYATRAGMLDLEWDVICPGCRGASERHAQLYDLQKEAHCPSCLIRYDVDFEESVELRFGISPDIRTAADLVFCVGGPANTRHIMMQIWLEAGEQRDIIIRLEPGSYRLRSQRIAERSQIDVQDAATSHEASIIIGEHNFSVQGNPLEAGENLIHLANISPQRMMLIMEQSAWNVQAASAALVTSLDEFRQLFSSQVLAPGLGISIRNLTFLFSDLKDSTRIYDVIGDTPAYARVRDHFAVMRTIITRHDGALVKTIGDAVMAVFRSADAALQSAIDIQREFTVGEINRGDPALRVKLGLHHGPCIAVNANDVLDYFGSTVNIAARVQSESIGDDIVVTSAMMTDPGVERLLATTACAIEEFQRALKGFSREFTLWRITLPDVVAAVEAGEVAGEPQPLNERR